MTFTLLPCTTERPTSRHRRYVYFSAGLWFSGSSNTTGLTIIRKVGMRNGALLPSSEEGHGTLPSSKRTLYSRRNRFLIYRITMVILVTWGGLRVTDRRQRYCKWRQTITRSVGALTTTRNDTGRFYPKCSGDYTWAPLFGVRTAPLVGRATGTLGRRLGRLLLGGLLVGPLLGPAVLQRV